MVVFQFKMGNVKYPITVTIQEEEAETAVEQLRQIEAAYDEEEPSTPTSGPVPGGWKPPTIN